MVRERGVLLAEPLVEEVDADEVFKRRPLAKSRC